MSKTVKIPGSTLHLGINLPDGKIESNAQLTIETIYAFRIDAVSPKTIFPQRVWSRLNRTDLQWQIDLLTRRKNEAISPKRCGVANLIPHATRIEFPIQVAKHLLIGGIVRGIRRLKLRVTDSRMFIPNKRRTTERLS